MPAIPTPVELLENILVYRDAVTNTSTPVPDQKHLEVVCAWPVSGQYGPGTRVLYYALVAACVFARRTEWIRNACLAAVLLFPAVAALHGIALAALHRNGGVDMDVYGAFQLCAIGVLTAPVTVRLSKTYFNNPGRDIIFLWTGLLLAGLLSLTVEFFRLEPTICPPDNPATLEWSQTGKFPYGSMCDMTCGNGSPSSPMRKDASDNIYVIPAPQELTFNTATLLAAACCIPAILSLVSTWIKILEHNWETLARREQTADDGEKPEDQIIEGTNGATPKHMTGIAERIRRWLTLIEIPVFSAAVMAILVKGEMNFFSAPVKYMTEPMSSVGQWAPIVGTGLAVVGSLYLLVAADMVAEDNEEDPSAEQQPNPRSLERCPRCATCAIYDYDSSSSARSRHSSHSRGRRASTELSRTATHPSVTRTVNRTETVQTEQTLDARGRRKVARFFNTLSKELTRKVHKQIQESGFNRRGRTEYPMVPGEPLRNRNLPVMQEAYRSTPVPRSRAQSFIGSIHSNFDSPNGEGSSRTPQRSSTHLSLPTSPPPRAVTRRRHADTLPGSFEGRERPNLAVLDYEYVRGRQRSLSRGSVSNEEQVSRTPSIPEVSPTDVAFDGNGEDTSSGPRIVVSTS